MICAAANELLAEDGLEGLTIRAVLARTGLARRAFYERFQGKDDLVLAVFAETLRNAGEQFGALAREAPDATEGLRRIVIGIVLGQLGFEPDIGSGHNRRSAALSREHLRLAESRPADLQAALRPLLDIIAWQVEQGIASGQFRDCDPQVHSKLVYNLVATTVHVELLAEEGGLPDYERRKQLAEAIWQFCRRATVADPTG
ncbi:TetR/AcrR family transcriptional regulator [Novosphingobium sp. PC22D]|uniref:TetR/AcrR family transcriptional regulator n=1 Tax=Novosphingobium sp. PC22D TaxID=1962403 RepID=UPI000BF247B6|nr:TetR/AcrR family transcriptional regulator [Novosphingobium sp. PC22D]